ncbi:MAG TPA: hypothetical protein VG225_01720 [Terracidiphilus sp.]|nr:hypothetical protein [Terracidiphilus sp.]
MKARLEPGDAVNDAPVRIFVELQSSQPATGLVLECISPPGFEVTPRNVALPEFQKQFTSSAFTLRRSGKTAEVGQQNTLIVRVLSADQKAAIAEASVSFSYVKRIPIWEYLLLGFFGIALGYAIRLLIKVLQTVPAPALAPDPNAPQPGTITQWVQKHYYFVDCSVTLVIGLLSLTLLLKNDHVPDSGLYWYSALGAGVALGLLANSELVSKLGR